jgi:alpha-beta hydrolase superfamily lysophospholipase
MALERENVEYWSGGARIRGWFYATAGPPAPALVLCPGFTGTKFAAFYTPYIKHLVEGGWNVLLADYRGWGESEGPRGEIVPLRQVADIRAGLTYLETRPDVDALALSVFGVSFGGGVAVHAAGLDARIRCCIAVSPVSDGTQWLRQMRREYEWYEFLAEVKADEQDRNRGHAPMSSPAADGIMVPTPERLATTVKGTIPDGMVPKSTPLWCAQEIMDFRPLDIAQRISPGALLLFNVSRDAVVPPEHARNIFERAQEPKRLVPLEGAAHYGAYLEHFSTISGTSLDWLRRYGTGSAKPLGVSDSS